MQSRSTKATPTSPAHPEPDLSGRLNLAHDGAWVSVDVQVCPNGCVVAADLADRHRTVCGR